MRIVPSLAWSLDADPLEPLDERLLPLLDAIAGADTLAAATANCGVSYRAAWEILRHYQRKLGVALVLLERGRGASLTPAGQQLLGAQRAAARRLARIFPALAADIGPELRRERAPPMLQLRVAASNDPALAAWADTLPAAAALTLELGFMGSLHAIEAFAEGRVDVAGFHVPIAGCATLERRPFLQWLRGRRDRLLRFVDRDQGLILRHGNPARVRNFRDIAAKGLRFVNRQRGSGTRLLVDQLLVDNGIDSMDISGYRVEEFTHGAVAATVASGGADAGFGLRAAAAEYQLAFVPVLRERYFLAVRAKALESAPIVRLIAALRSPAFARSVRLLAGYRPTGAGTVMPVAALVTKRAR